MKTVFRLILAAVAALSFVSCAQTPDGRVAISVPGGQLAVGTPSQPGGGYGHPQGRQYADNGHGGPQGRHYRENGQGRPDGRQSQHGERRRKLIEGEDDYYSKSTWNNDYFPNVDLQVLGRDLNDSDFALRDDIRDWAVKYHKTHNQTPPTNDQATAKAEESRGKGQVRVTLGNSQPNPTLTKRERVMEKDVPQEDRAAFQQKALEQFMKTGENKPVTNGKFYNN